MKITPLRSWKHKVNIDQYEMLLIIYGTLSSECTFKFSGFSSVYWKEGDRYTYQFSHAACICLELKYFKLPCTKLLII